MKCSVIVANYNNADVIPVALRSIEAQTYSNWEVVIVDDASADNSVQVINAYLNNSPYRSQYTFVRLTENAGIGNAKKVAVEHATGEVVAVCDPDDALHTDALSKVIKEHTRNTQASIVYSNYFYCDANLIPQRTRSNAGPVLYSDLLENKVSNFVSFKREAYSKTVGFDPFFRAASDKDLYYKLEEVGDIVYLDEPLYYYRIWSRGISQGFAGHVRSRDYKLVAIDYAMKRREISGIKKLKPQELRCLLAEVHLLQAEGIVFSNLTLSNKFVTHLLKAFYYNPLGQLKRKLKVVLMLHRIKRKIQGKKV